MNKKQQYVKVVYLCKIVWGAALAHAPACRHTVSCGGTARRAAQRGGGRGGGGGCLRPLRLRRRRQIAHASKVTPPHPAATHHQIHVKLGVTTASPEPRHTAYLRLLTICEYGPLHAYQRANLLDIERQQGMELNSTSILNIFWDSIPSCHCSWVPNWEDLRTGILNCFQKWETVPLCDG